MDMAESLKRNAEALKIANELENINIESEIKGLVITLNWKMQVERVNFESEELVSKLNSKEKRNLEKAILDSINKGIVKSQEEAAKRMWPLFGSMGIGIGQ